MHKATLPKLFWTAQKRGKALSLSTNERAPFKGWKWRYRISNPQHESKYPQQNIEKQEYEDKVLAQPEVLYAYGYVIVKSLCYIYWYLLYKFPKDTYMLNDPQYRIYRV